MRTSFGPGSGSSTCSTRTGPPTSRRTAASMTFTPTPRSARNRRLSPWFASLARSRQLDRLQLGELRETVRAELTAVAGLLVPAEGGQGVEGGAVDVHLPGAQPAGER